MTKQEITMQGTVVVCHYPSIGKTFRFDTAKYPAEIGERAKSHGYVQKFVDAKAGGTPAEKAAEVQAIHASLLVGEWTRTGRPDPAPLILQAVARIRSLKLDLEARTLSNGKKTVKPSEEQIKIWGADERVRATILQLRAEKATKDAAASNNAEIEVKFD